LLNLIFAEWYAILQNDDGNRSRRRPKSLALDKFANVHADLLYEHLIHRQGA
jgi:hypothetical protein